METVTLRGEDFTRVHNALCELRSITDRCSDRLAAELNSVIHRLEEGLWDAYQQDEASFDDKMEYYGAFADQNDLNSIWSVYELPVHGFLQPHPYPSDAFVVYGKGHVPVLGPTWGDVYRAADCAIRNSGDLHHIFIEHFEQVGNELRLTTGS